MSEFSSECLQFSREGVPHEVVEVVRHVLPALESNDVRVRMKFAPINPADLNFISGTYGRKARLPCIPGHEGVGIVEQTGDHVKSLNVGDIVIPLIGGGAWAQHMSAAEHFFAKLPDGMNLQQASMLRINPVTAALLLDEFCELPEGSWVIQNAANSSVGQCVVQLARSRNLRVLSLVRREENIPQLRELDATEVMLDSDAGLEQARECLRGNEVHLALNGVGGDSAIRLMELLSPGGTVVTYGAMSRRSLKVPNRFLIFKDLTLRGLWVSRWLERAGPDALFRVLEPLARAMANGELQMSIEQVLHYTQAQEALKRAAESGRMGKVLLSFDDALQEGLR